MREPYVPLFCSITDSTIWSLDAETCKVFITMLAMADPEGYIAAAIDGIAVRSRLSVDQVESAIKKLSAPDPRSRNKSSDGRRVVEVERGWFIPAIPWFRQLARHEAEKARKRLWARENNSGRPSRASATPRRTETETETEEKILPSVGAPKRKRCSLPEGFTPNAKHRQLADERCVHLQSEFESFKDHHTAKGSLFIDWNAALRMWIRNAKKFQPWQSKTAAPAGTMKPGERPASKVKW